MSEAEVKYIALKQLCHNTYNPRKIVDNTEQEELTSNIKENGILQPILVRPKNRRFEVVAGERRFNAALKLNLQTVPCIVKEMTDATAYKCSVLENVVRANMNPADEAEAVRRIVAEHGKKEASKVFGKSLQWVSLRDAVAQFPQSVIQLVRDGALSLSHCDELAVLASEDQIERLAKDCVRCRLTVQELRKKVRESLRSLADPVFSTCDRYEDDYGCLHPCDSCVSRSDKQADMFGTSSSESLCLDGACWARKLDAHIEQLKRLKIENGFELVPDCEKYAASAGFGKYTRNHEEIAELKENGTKPILLIAEDGNVLECWKRKERDPEPEDLDEPDEATDHSGDSCVSDIDELVKKEFITIATSEVMENAKRIDLRLLNAFILDTIHRETTRTVIDVELEKDGKDSINDSGWDSEKIDRVLLSFICERYLKTGNAERLLNAVGIDYNAVMQKAKTAIV